MTADVLREFVASPAGHLYGKVCDRWGLDPGAPLEDDDDVLAFNLRAALALALKPEDEPKAELDDDGNTRVRTNLLEQMNGA